MTRPAEERAVHTRLLKCALEIEESRAWWQRATPGRTVSPQEAYEGYWFGAKSLPRVEVLLANLRARFDAFPAALRVLHGWADLDPAARATICHWHLQLSDPLYRAFTGDLLVARRDALRRDVTRDRVIAWVGDQGPERWTLATRVQFASKLLSAAYSAGIVGSNRDPRPLTTPKIQDDTLTYLVYLLRETDFEGTLLDNPYLRSVGLTGAALADRLRGLDALRFQRQGDLLDMGWRYPSLEGWAAARAAA